jgi:hypothetical protein
MNRLTLGRGIALAVMAAALVTPKLAFAQGYTFKVVASSATHGGSQFQIGDLNNKGQFNFNIVGATKDNPLGGEAHFVYDGTSVILVHPTESKLPDGSTPGNASMWTPMGINDNGRIAYVADTDMSPHAIMIFDFVAKQYTLVAKNDTVVDGGKLTSAGVALESRMVADINNKDQVVWSEGLEPTAGGDANDAVFMYDSATKKITTVARAGTPLPGGKQVLNALYPNINELGEVVFMANHADNENYGIYQWANGNITAICAPGTKVGDLTIAQAKLARNADGYVVFRGETTSSGGAVPVGEDTGYFLYTAATGAITKVVAPGDALPGGKKLVSTEPGGGRRSVGVNKNGLVIFKAVMENEEQGIYFWKDGTITPLVTSGQTIETSFKLDGIVQGLGGQNGYHMALNDFGDVAFTAVSGDVHAAILATAPR